METNPYIEKLQNLALENNIDIIDGVNNESSSYYPG